MTAHLLAFLCGLLGIVGFHSLHGLLKDGVLRLVTLATAGCLAAWGAVLFVAQIPGGRNTLTAMLTGLVAGGALSALADERHG